MGPIVKVLPREPYDAGKFMHLRSHPTQGMMIVTYGDDGPRDVMMLAEDIPKDISTDTYVVEEPDHVDFYTEAEFEQHFRSA